MISRVSIHGQRYLRALASSGTFPIPAAGTLLRVVAGTAVITVCGQIAIALPFTPVPITLGTLAVLALPQFLPVTEAVGSAALYVVLAGLGFPVLAGWSGGVGVTFGYVIGYVCAAWIAAGARHASPIRRAIVLLTASASFYVFGLPWLHVMTGVSWQQVYVLGFFPFILGDTLKFISVFALSSLSSHVR